MVNRGATGHRVEGAGQQVMSFARGSTRSVELHRIGVDSLDEDSDVRAGWIVGGWDPSAFDLDAVKRSFHR